LHTIRVYKVDRVAVSVVVAVVEDEFANSIFDRITAHVVVAVDERYEFANSIDKQIAQPLSQQSSR